MDNVHSFQHQSYGDNTSILTNIPSVGDSSGGRSTTWRTRLVFCCLALASLSLAYCFIVFTKAAEACYVTPCYEGAGWQTLWMVNRGVTVAGTSSGIFFVIHAALGLALFRRRNDQDEQSAGEFLQEAHFVVGIFAGCTLCASLLSINMVWIWGAERNLIHNLEKINPTNEAFDESGRHMAINRSLIDTFDALTYISASVCLFQVMVGSFLLLARKPVTKYFRLLGGDQSSTSHDEMVPLHHTRSQQRSRPTVNTSTLLTVIVGILSIHVHTSTATQSSASYLSYDYSMIHAPLNIRGGAHHRSSTMKRRAQRPFIREQPSTTSISNSKPVLPTSHPKPGLIPSPKQNAKHNDLDIQKRWQRIQQSVIAVAISVTIYGLWETRTSWMGFFDKEKLQAYVLGALRSLQDDLPKAYSCSLYVIGMALWETLGLSTIPVETAAGMVFGWTGALLSGLGKLLGACLAFWLGKTALRDFVQRKLGDNSFLKLVKSSTTDNPPLVACLIKFSCFPETM
jgi:hypothetical protein